MSALSFLNNFISARNTSNPQAGGANTFGLPFGPRAPQTFVEALPPAGNPIDNIAPLPRGSYSPLVPSPEGSPMREAGMLYLPQPPITSNSAPLQQFFPGDTTSPEVNIQFGSMTPEEYFYGNPRQMMPNGMGQMVKYPGAI